MPNAALVGRDSAGGVILGGGNNKLSTQGAMVAVVGDAVAGHGRSPHDGPVMVTGSSKFTVGGIPICLAGSSASCGHTASGSSKLSVSS